MEQGLITQVLKLKDVYPELKGTENITFADDAVLVRKGIVPEDVVFDEGERSSWDYITTGAKDRDNEIVDPAGGIFDDFMKNPVVLFGHNHWGMPVGKCTEIKIGKNNVAAKTIYANTAQANEIYEYRKAGFPMAKSIGFIPLKITRYEPESEEGKQGIRQKYDKWLLLEYSDVPVPSNPEALQIAISKGLLTQEQADKFNEIPVETPEKKIPKELDYDFWYELENLAGIMREETELEITKPGWDETDNMIRYRVRDPGLFRDGTFRTVPIKKDKPRVNSVMGKLKKNEGQEEDPMTVQNLMFPKEDDWTLDAAKKWKSEHENLLKFIECAVSELITAELCVTDDEIIYTYPERLDDKSGRVLSGKNKEIITRAVGAMKEAAAALDELLSATETTEESANTLYTITVTEDKKYDDQSVLILADK